MAQAYYLRDGRPTTRAGWADKQRDPDYQRVEAGHASQAYWVSTVWLGTTEAGQRPPLIFETRVFLDATQDSVDAARYATEAEARAGHAALMAKWGAG